MASLSLLAALLVLPWLLTARRRPAAPPSSRVPAWTPPAPRQPERPWTDPDDWWREASALPSRAPRPVPHRAAAPLEV
ncbi:hypothetical protein [Geodermatophilus sp. SYSU D00766]